VADTPRWVGYIVQRPEMHRLHHERGKHTNNFGDIVIGDVLFGTCRNPARYDGPCGFPTERELSLKKMQLFRNVNGVCKKRRS
jgi:sterol desaturase/sphingolipid hydroxylase (fatty acid hydroxylase superfamily)